MSKVTYIVSAQKRPQMLRCCLASLAVQTDCDFEVIVADNAPEYAVSSRHEECVSALQDSRFRYIDTDCIKTCAGWDCYHSAEYVAALPSVTSAWLCFPSDDSYYVPTFQQTMLYYAEKNGWDLVYCDMLRNDDSKHGRAISGLPVDYYFKWDVSPTVGGIDKTGFLVKRSEFMVRGFPHKNTAEQAPTACDGYLIDCLVKSGVKHGKAAGIMAVHN